MDHVTGVRETIKGLRALEPALARASVRDIKKAAEPTRKAMIQAMPYMPLSGMALDRRPVVKTKYGGRARSGRGSGKGKMYPLVRFTVLGWTAAADMAAKASPGESFVRNLTAKYGAASRWAYPTVDRHTPQLIAALKAAVEAAEKVARDAMRK